MYSSGTRVYTLSRHDMMDGEDEVPRGTLFNRLSLLTMSSARSVLVRNSEIVNRPAGTGIASANL